MSRDAGSGILRAGAGQLLLEEAEEEELLTSEVSESVDESEDESLDDSLVELLLHRLLRLLRLCLLGEVPPSASGASPFFFASFASSWSWLPHPMLLCGTSWCMALSGLCWLQTLCIVWSWN